MPDAATGDPYPSTTSHPAMIGHRCRSPLWRLVRKPGLSAGRTQAGRRTLMGRTAAVDRLTAGFRYVGRPRVEEAQRFGVIRSTGVPSVSLPGIDS